MTKKIKLYNIELTNDDLQSIYINSCNSLLSFLRQQLESLQIKITKLELKMNNSQKIMANRYKNKTQK